MPLDLQPGVEVPIPCRPCGQAFAKFTVAPGRHVLKCALCGGETLVTVSDEAGRWVVRTASREEKGAVIPRR